MREVPNYQQSFVANYESHNVDKTLAGRMLQKSHALLEGMLPPDFTATRILEVGAGSGHHFQYVRHPFTEYLMTDTSAAMLAVAASRYAEEIKGGKLRITEQNAAALDFPDASFDRLIATHILEHIPNPVAVLQEWHRVVKTGGTISIVLPCDPGLLWRFGRCLGPRRNALKMGLPYDYVMATDHVNAIFNLRTIIQYHFENLQEKWYPLHLPWPDGNLFYLCHITKT